MPDSITIPANAAEASRPDFVRAEQKVGQLARSLCHAFMRGTEAVRALGEDALPKWPAEEVQDYKIRLNCCAVTAYYARTVQASVGMMLATPPKFADGTAAQILSDAEDIDGKGTHLEVFARRLAEEVINGGFACVLVDSPPRPEGIEFYHSDEIALGLRPAWVLIPADRILSWIVELPDWEALIRDYKAGTLTADQVKAYAKQVVIRQVVIYEPTDVRAGDFGTTCTDRYRVLKLTDAGVIFEVWEKVEGDKDISFKRISAGRMLAANDAALSEIPLAVIYGGKQRAPFVADPALLPLAELNLDHFQVSADRRYLMRICHAPTLYRLGFEDEIDEAGRKKPVKIGPNSVITSSNPNAKIGYTSASPDALNSSKEEKEECVRQMATIGMSFIGKDKRGNFETATGRALDDAAENATHATVARGLQDGIEQALRFHALMRGVEPAELTINTSYASPDVDPQIATVLWNAVAADKLPIEVFVHYIRTAELPDDVDMQIELLRRIQQEAANNTAAAENANTDGKPKPGDKAAAGDPAEQAA